MAIALICTGKDTTPWIEALRELAPSLDIRIHPDDPREGVEFAILWKHPPGALALYPDLKALCSMGAGVDHMLGDPELPLDLPVVRLVDPLLASSMGEYVKTAALYYLRDFDLYRAQQAKGVWNQLEPRKIEEATVGVLGLGQLGGYVAKELDDEGFKVLGWADSPRELEGVECYEGEEGLEALLPRVDILVCLLPLTGATEGILNGELFSKLPKGARLINVARGGHLVEGDLLEALEAGQLGGAWLDVFNEEPLPTDHPFWSHENIMLTPHSSSITEPGSVAPQIVENYRRLKAGEALLNRVDIKRGY